MKSSSSDHPYLLQVYIGYGNQEKYSLKGRVLENEQLLEQWSDSKIRNLWETWKRAETDEIPGAKVRLYYKGDHQEDHFSQEVITDEEGYFHFEGKWPRPLNKGHQWVKVQLTLVEPSIPLLPLEEEAEILIPDEKATYGVLSDVDDTVLQTHMTSRMKLKMMYVSFMKGAHQRLPMEGMQNLLTKLNKGKDNQFNNPIFYVSNSPWNIYDVLYDFIHLQKLPKGPLMLRDFGLQLIFKSKDHIPHKLLTIRHILRIYAKLPFVFLGDTASNDADYYLQMAEEFPGRVKAIYIRETKDNKNARRIRELFTTANNPNFLVVKSTQEIMDHMDLKNII